MKIPSAYYVYIRRLGYTPFTAPHNHAAGASRSLDTPYPEHPAASRFPHIGAHTLHDHAERGA